MMRYKTWLIRAGVVLALYYLFTRPANAAEAVAGLKDGVLNGANQLAIFLNHLI